jgi:signal transduction histidine kinase
LTNGIFRNGAPQGPLFLLFPALGLMSIIVGLFWDHAKGSTPIWMGTVICLLFGGGALWLCFQRGPYDLLVLAESGNHVIMALLVIFVFRRLSPGVFMSVLAFTVWALPTLLIFHRIADDAYLNFILSSFITMAKVAAALGLILLALEDELAVNKASGERERRARKEVEAYTNLELSRRRVEDFDRQAFEICETIIENSCFSKAALILLQGSGQFRLTGHAGIDYATAKALDALAARIPAATFLEPSAQSSAVEKGKTVTLSLEPWLEPGDDLKRLHFTSVTAVPMHGRSNTEGALLLAGTRNRRPDEALRPDDLIPVEMFAARLQAARSQTRMLEKLIDSEKFAGLGQLAGSVTQQLNNPLTVILGYASLLEEAPRLDAQERKGIDAILTEARNMRSTLESLSRIARSPSGQLAAISVAELLSDMEQLHRSEFLQRGIELAVTIAPGLPRILCQPQQLRQAVLHCLQFAIAAVEKVDAKSDKTVRLVATAEGRCVQIMVAHSGAVFENPERAFDPFVPPQGAGAETTGLGLSLCATILRDNNGSISAVNLESRGAAILMELQSA